MTKEKIKELEDSIPKKHKQIDFSKERGLLYDYLINIKGEYGFDISDNNFNNCCWGSNEETKKLLFDLLHRINCEDVDICYNYYSDISDVSWFKIVLKITIEELRKRKQLECPSSLD